MTHTDAKINALIATKVMGWHETDSVWHLSQRRGWAHADGEGECVLADWHPLTDPAQAVRALETFCARGDVILEQIALVDGPMWLINMTVWDGEYFNAASGEGDFCRAVCAALVEAVG
ncbi:MAG: hypothetical protein WC683_08115 [bacterium]